MESKKYVSPIEQSRNVGGSSYTLSYDAENRTQSVQVTRLVSVSRTKIVQPHIYDAGKVAGAVTATFVYDGDGNRVKGTVANATTSYIGNYFEWTGSTTTMKKYYYAGSVKVAMRTGSSIINYLLGDHLGSNAITTTSTGVKYSDIRYMPWGTTRYTSGSSPTTYQYTGQRVEKDLGLLFYNARWYDPMVGRFIQADTVIPGGVQGLDRYAYVGNSPINFTDPSGNARCTADGNCTNYVSIEAELWNYKISLGSEWMSSEKVSILQSASTIGNRLSGFTGGTAAYAFQKVFGATKFTRDTSLGNLGGQWIGGSVHLNPDLMDQYIVTHEMGHVFQANVYENKYNLSPANILTDLGLNTEIVDNLGGHVSGLKTGDFKRTDLGYQSCNGLPSCRFEEHPLDMEPDGNTAGEDVADMFLNWSYDSFDYSAEANGAGNARNNWMNSNMYMWINYSQP